MLAPHTQEHILQQQHLMSEDSACLQILYLEDQANGLASELPTALTLVPPLITRKVDPDYMLSPQRSKVRAFFVHSLQCYWALLVYLPMRGTSQNRGYRECVTVAFIHTTTMFSKFCHLLFTYVRSRPLQLC